MMARRLAAASAGAALGLLVFASAAMAQAAGGGNQSVDPVHAIDNLRAVVLAIGGLGFLSLMLPALVLVWKRKYELAIGLFVASLIPGLFIFAFFVVRALVNGFGDRLTQ